MSSRARAPRLAAVLLSFGAKLLAARGACRAADAARRHRPPMTFTGIGLSILWAVPFAGVLLSLALGPMLAAGVLAPPLRQDHRLLGRRLPDSVHRRLWRRARPGISSRTPCSPNMFRSSPAVRALHDRGRDCGARDAGRHAGAEHGAARRGRHAGQRMGTTGAAMLLIRPLLRANEARQHACMSSCSSSFWSATSAARSRRWAIRRCSSAFSTASISSGPRARWRCRRSTWPARCWRSSTWSTPGSARRESVAPPASYEPLAIDGAVNFVLIAGVVGAVLLSGIWKPGIVFDVAGTPLELQEPRARRRAVRCSRAAVAALTPRGVRDAQRIHVGADRRGGQALRGIFLTIVPLIAMLQAGRAGAFARVVALVTDRRPASRAHDVLLGDRVCCRRSSTMRRRIWCSSTLPAAMRRR